MTGSAAGRARGRQSRTRNCPPCPSPTSTAGSRHSQYARISLARDLIRDRKGEGLSQQRLADLAGIRQETLSKIQTGKHTASQPHGGQDHCG